MRPCDLCGDPIGNAETHCKNCRSKDNTLDVQTSIRDSLTNSPVRISNASNAGFVLQKLLEFSIGALMLGMILGATAFGVTYGLLSLTLSISIPIAILIGIITAGAFLFSQIAG